MRRALQVKPGVVRTYPGCEADMDRRAFLVLLASPLFSGGCAITTSYGPALYPHHTIEGAPFKFAGLVGLAEGMTTSEVREALGEPLEVAESEDSVRWRYFERANPMWCDSGSENAVAPEYSIEASIIFKNSVLVSKDVKQSGRPVFP